MKKLIIAGGLLASSLVACAAERTITVEDYRDKMKAAWVGQMVGVVWGFPTEFRFCDRIVPEDKVPTWSSELLKIGKDGPYNNDDLYVEMAFLKTLEDYGLDASIRQAGIDFANTKFRVWAANDRGRSNLRRSIAPPDCSHPRFNEWPNAIDYQIEADYSGIISPGCPQEAIRLGNLFGRLMNYGDGMWAGQFIGALYAEAFFTRDIDKLLDVGLAAIPAESDYATMVRNVRAWHKEFPNDWTKCWEKIRDAYSKDYHTRIGSKAFARKGSNGAIDVRLNGACVVLGLLYGKGDIDKSMELSMRCGWDSDCNPSSVGGILMTMCGFKALPKKYTETLDDTKKFEYTTYDTPKLLDVCEKLARQIVVRNGGRVEKGADGKEVFVIPVKKPVPDAFVPSWQAPAPKDTRYTLEEMKKIYGGIRLPDPSVQEIKDPTVRVQKVLDSVYPGWTTSTNAPDMTPGYVYLIEGTDATFHTVSPLVGLLRTHPPAAWKPVTLSRKVKVPADKNATLHFEVSNSPGGDFLLIVRVDGAEMLRTEIESRNSKTGAPHMRAFDISLKPWAGREVTIELVNYATGWACEAALWRNIRINMN